MVTPSRFIRVMISSRCRDEVAVSGGGTTRMTDVREAIRKRLESERLCGAQVFRVDITPEHDAGGANETFWEASLRKVRAADVVLVLYNGDPGYPHPRGDLGICHAEFDAAVASGAGRTRIVTLPEKALPRDTAARTLRERFSAALEESRAARSYAANAAEAVEKAVEAVLETVLELAAEGARRFRAGKADSGASLDWTRLSFADRKRRMEDVLCETLGAGSEIGSGSTRTVPVAVGGRTVLFVCHAVPAALSVAAAREMVGRPFLVDHQLSTELETYAGPVHLIACHKGVTEKQATDLLGFPDATVVKSGFGVYVSDPLQKVQLVLLANCHNPSHTKDAVGRFFDWLEREQQGTRLVETSAARARIVRAIAAEQNSVPNRDSGPRPAGPGARPRGRRGTPRRRD